MDELERRFHMEMIHVYELAKKHCNYNATRFLQMVSDHGGLQTAKNLINAETLSDGFRALWECGRLDLTVEAVAIRDQWRALFTEEELKRAEERLGALGYS